MEERHRRAHVRRKMTVKQLTLGFTRRGERTVIGPNRSFQSSPAHGDEVYYVDLPYSVTDALLGEILLTWIGDDSEPFATRQELTSSSAQYHVPLVGAIYLRAMHGERTLIALGAPSTAGDAQREELLYRSLRRPLHTLAELVKYELGQRRDLGSADPRDHLVLRARPLLDAAPDWWSPPPPEPITPQPAEKPPRPERGDRAAQLAILRWYDENEPRTPYSKQAEYCGVNVSAIKRWRDEHGLQRRKNAPGRK